MYNNPYMTYLSPQYNIDKINAEISNLEKQKAQMQQTIQPITQNFNLSSNTSVKYANTIEEVKKEVVYGDTPFFSKDFSVMWLKNNKGDIKAFELKEIIQKDDKDLQIEYLQEQIEELKGMIKNEQHNSNVYKQDVSTSTTKDNDAIREQTQDDKSTNVQRVSRSKKE